MVDDLFFCSTLMGRRGGRILFLQTGAETSDTDAEAVKPNPGSSWEVHSGRVDAGVWDENAVLRDVHPLCIPLVIHPLCLLLSDKLRNCVAGTNECLDLRRRVSALDRQVSPEWSRCPDSMARRAKESVAPLRRSSAS